MAHHLNVPSFLEKYCSSAKIFTGKEEGDSCAYPVAPWHSQMFHVDHRRPCHGHDNMVAINAHQLDLRPNLELVHPVASSKDAHDFPPNRRIHLHVDWFCFARIGQSDNHWQHATQYHQNRLL